MQKSKSKFFNKKIETKYGKFDSKREYTIFLKYKRQEELGIIKNLQRQIPFVLIDKSEYGREIKYIADFVYEEISSGEILVVDVKGLETPVFKLKARLFAERYGREIKIVK